MLNAVFATAKYLSNDFSLSRRTQEDFKYVTVIEETSDEEEANEQELDKVVFDKSHSENVISENIAKISNTCGGQDDGGT